MTKTVHEKGWPPHPRNNDGMWTLDVTVRETGKKLVVQGSLDDCIEYIGDELEAGFMARLKYRVIQEFFRG